MRIYTRTGDTGDTGLVGGARRSKADVRIEAYGDVDETSAALGVVGAAMRASRDRLRIRTIQEELFQIGAHLASTDPKRAGVPLPGRDAIARFEAWIDEAWGRCEPLRTFILPGGSPRGAALHYARTVCRRAERRVVALAAREKVPAEVIVYLNRLSDWLFAWARDVNRRDGAPETPWRGREGRHPRRPARG